MTGPKQSLYELLGGEAPLRALVEAFYDIVERAPEADPLHRLHLRGHGVAHSRTEQFDFLSGFFGGPRLYVDRHGHSRLRELHAHVPIDADTRALWLRCMAQALEESGFQADMRRTLMAHFTRAAELIGDVTVFSSQ